MQVNTIAEQLFFTTVRIDTVAPDSSEGAGTGFIFSYKVDDQNYNFIVTNKHVVVGTREGTLLFHEGHGLIPKLGSGFKMSIKDWSKVWFGHPSPDIDIAVCPLQPIQENIKRNNNVDIFYRVIGNNLIPTPSQVAELDALESIIFIGYPNGIWDSKNLLPVARRGMTATPVEVDFEGTPRFLVDASVFGGSSGSPVFILSQGMYTAKDGGTVIGSRFYFIGVIAAVFFRTSLNQIIPVPIPTQVQPMVQQQEMIDLGIVFKSSCVLETVQAFLKSKGISIA